MREQGKAVAWCGRLLLFAALICGIVTMHTFGHPAGGHGGHATLSAQTTRSAQTPLSAQATQPTHSAHAAHSAHPTHAMAAPPMAAYPAPHLADHPTDRHSAAPDGGGAMDPGAVCRAVLSFWAPVVLVLLGTGVLLGQGSLHAGLLAALRALLLRGLRPIPPPPRRKVLARLSVLRV